MCIATLQPVSSVLFHQVSAQVITWVLVHDSGRVNPGMGPAEPPGYRPTPTSQIGGPESTVLLAENILHNASSAQIQSPWCKWGVGGDWEKRKDEIPHSWKERYHPELNCFQSEGGKQEGGTRERSVVTVVESRPSVRQVVVTLQPPSFCQCVCLYMCVCV